MANGTKEQKEMAQDALNRFWWPSIMMFGPQDSDSPRTGNAMKWKIKRQTTDITGISGSGTVSNSFQICSVLPLCIRICSR